MIPHYSDERATFYHGDALKVLTGLADYVPLIEERLRRAPHGIQAALL